MMKEELNLSLEGYEHPIKNALIIGFAAIVGSLIPLLPFFFIKNVLVGVVLAIIIYVIALFATGIYKAKFTLCRWWKEGVELAVLGMGAAGLGYGIGLALRILF
jgi:VIT1/CCC1 family predicted Fe2+/Mn2+ transporter